MVHLRYEDELSRAFSNCSGSAIPHGGRTIQQRLFRSRSGVVGASRAAPKAAWKTLTPPCNGRPTVLRMLEEMTFQAHPVPSSNPENSRLGSSSSTFTTTWSYARGRPMATGRPGRVYRTFVYAKLRTAFSRWCRSSLSPPST